MDNIAPPKGGWGDYRCRIGGVREGLWDPVHGGHTDLLSSKNFDLFFGIDV